MIAFCVQSRPSKFIGSVITRVWHAWEISPWRMFVSSLEFVSNLFVIPRDYKLYRLFRYETSFKSQTCSKFQTKKAPTPQVRKALFYVLFSVLFGASESQLASIRKYKLGVYRDFLSGSARVAWPFEAVLDILYIQTRARADPPGQQRRLSEFRAAQQYPRSANQLWLGDSLRAESARHAYVAII